MVRDEPARTPVGEGRVATGAALLGALAGWLALEAYTALLGPPLGFTPDLASLLGTLLLPAASRAATLWAGRVALLVVALLWGVVYTRVYGSLPGAGWARGALFGAGVWLVASTLLLPLLGALHPLVRAGQQVDPGLLGLGLGGARALLFSLGEHLLFGAILGAVAGPRA